MMPSDFSGVLYWANSVFLTMPLRVASTRYFASEKLRVRMTVFTCSSCVNGKRLTIARPFDCRAPSGSSCTFSRYTFPRVEKKRM